MKILCLLLPHFPLRCEIQRRPALQSSQTLVTYSAGSQRLLLDYSPELKGLQTDMPLQQAISKYGEAGIVPADMPSYRRAFDKILDSLEQISPLVEGAHLGCAYLGLKGLEGLYPSLTALSGVVRAAVPEVYEARIGVAEGKFIACLAALYSEQGKCQILKGDVGAFLQDIPCDVLPVSQKSKKKLHDFGLHTLGQAAQLALGPLQAQFGYEGKRISDLAQGHDDTPLYPRQSEEMIEESMTLSSMTVSLDAILAAIESLLSRAYTREGLNGKGIRKLTFWAQVWCSGYWERSINFKEPAMNARAALSRIRDVLSNSPFPGAVEELGLKVTGLSREKRRQSNLFIEVRADDHLKEDIMQMELRLGGPQVFTVKEVEPWSRIPERRQALIPLSQ